MISINVTSAATKFFFDVGFFKSLNSRNLNSEITMINGFNFNSVSLAHVFFLVLEEFA